jgi:hypothetical protein
MYNLDLAVRFSHVLLIRQLRIRFREITFPTLGSRDVLCSFIGHAVISVVFEEDVSIRLQFDCGIISVPLSVASQRFGESALFTPGPNKPVIVF